LHAKRRVRGKGGRFLSKEEADKEKIEPHKSQETANNSPSTTKEHLASTSKSSNDGEYSQEEGSVHHGAKTNFNGKAPKSNDMHKDNQLEKNEINTKTNENEW